ncbi:hypothetical protein KAI87_14705, partial [Myxococcota bacterium]|nr:hypothetical protein [Myxococcota bacterium]
MIRLAFLLALLVAFLPHQSALASSDIIPGDILPGGPASELITETGTTIQVSKKRKRRKSRRKKKKKTKKEETKKEEPKKEILPGLDLSADVPEEDAEVPGVLDLSTVEGDTEAAKKELLMSGAPEESSSEGGSGFDFGGGFDLSGGDADEGGFDFGDDAGFDFGGEGFQIDSEQRERFEEAVSMMADEDYEDAALEFSFFLNDPVYKEFHPESEYQLAKALYKMGFLESSLNRFKIILARGPSHRRFRKSVQWLFFISRKVADEIPVLAELAKFRNVSFSKGYKDEFHYLLAKYLFIQAQRLEVEKLQKEKLEKDKKSKANEIDFSALADSMESDGGFDFGGGGFDFGGDDSGGGFDFGGGEEAAPAADEGGFDFGGGDDDAGDGGFDFGGGGDAAPAKSKDTAPKDSQEALRQGVELLVELNPENELYAESKYLQGLLAYLTGDDTQAVSSFQEVIRVLNPTQ